jgi:hypothetical protein
VREMRAEKVISSRAGFLNAGRPIGCVRPPRSKRVFHVEHCTSRRERAAVGLFHFDWLRLLRAAIALPPQALWQGTFVQLGTRAQRFAAQFGISPAAAKDDTLDRRE